MGKIVKGIRLHKNCANFVFTSQLKLSKYILVMNSICANFAMRGKFSSRTDSYMKMIKLIPERCKTNISLGRKGSRQGKEDIIWQDSMLYKPNCRSSKTTKLKHNPKLVEVGLLASYNDYIICLSLIHI